MNFLLCGAGKYFHGNKVTHNKANKYERRTAYVSLKAYPVQTNQNFWNPNFLNYPGYCKSTSSSDTFNHPLVLDIF